MKRKTHKSKFKVGEGVMIKAFGRVRELPNEWEKLYRLDFGGSVYPISVYENEMRKLTKRERRRGS